MSIALVILSDIHFTVGKGHPIPARVDAIASAISVTHHQLGRVIILLSGDIASTGLSAEFEIATKFLADLKLSLLRRIPHLDILVYAVPGNHDCLLPVEGMEHRLSRVNSSLKTIKEEQPDVLYLSDLLSVQDNYWKFASSTTEVPAPNMQGKLLTAVTIASPDGNIRLTLLNSALLSQRRESKSGLHLPVDYFRVMLASLEQQDLNISVLHHPSYWIEPTTFTALRQILNSHSDFVIAGHEHFNFSYRLSQLSGEEVAIYESLALFDSHHPTSSAFRVLVFDLASRRQKDSFFRWKNDLYRLDQAHSSDWKVLTTNPRTRSHSYNFSVQHLKNLEDTGIAYSHPTGTTFKLSDVFVFPNLRLAKSKDKQELVKGHEVLNHLGKDGMCSLQGATFSGKSALAKQLTLQFSTNLGRVPILLTGKQLSDATSEDLQKILLKTYRKQYAEPDDDEFLQLDSSVRVVIVDDWHLASLSDEQRVALCDDLSRFANSVIFTTDDSFSMKQYMTKTTGGGVSSALLASQAEIVGLSYVSRGALIANWYRLRKQPGDAPPETDNSVKLIEDRISSMLGKESLPPYAFFVLCMLQAGESNKLDNTAGGSFGAYHQVLITTALTRGNLDDNQLAGKTALCSEIAHYFWLNNVEVASEATVREIAITYAQKHLYSLQVEDLLRNLVEARVLERSEAHYSFAYSQFYYYFVAWYIRQHLDTAEGVELLQQIDTMVDSISSVENSSVVMFLIYFAADRNRIISRLVKNANAIYADSLPAALQDDVRSFEFHKDHLPAPNVPEDPDVRQNRDVERISKDDYDEEQASKKKENTYEAFSYSSELSEGKKIHLAEKNIEALGQVVRSFSTFLPGAQKVEVLTTTYSLGLRAMGHLLHKIAEYLEARAGVLKGSTQDWSFALADRSVSEMLDQIDEIMLIIGKAITIHYTRKISDSVGVADNELAYASALEGLPDSAAVKLIDSSILMDHSRQFPEEIIEKRIKEIKAHPFASNILNFLMARHVLLYRMDAVTRRRVSKLAGWDVQKMEEYSSKVQKLL